MPAIRRAVTIVHRGQTADGTHVVVRVLWRQLPDGVWYDIDNPTGFNATRHDATGEVDISRAALDPNLPDDTINVSTMHNVHTLTLVHERDFVPPSQ